MVTSMQWKLDVVNESLSYALMMYGAFIAYQNASRPTYLQLVWYGLLLNIMFQSKN